MPTMSSIACSSLRFCVRTIARHVWKSKARPMALIGVSEKTLALGSSVNRGDPPLTLSRCKPFSYPPLTALLFSVMVKVTYAHPPKALR